MKEKEAIVVSLDLLCCTCKELQLQKQIENAREKNFGTILDYMLDPRGDALNPIYDTEQKDFRDRIAARIESAIRTRGTNLSDKFDLMYKKPDNSLSQPLRLDERVKDFTDIIRQKTRRTDLGDLKYDAIDLVARYMPCC